MDESNAEKLIPRRAAEKMLGRLVTGAAVAAGLAVGGVVAKGIKDTIDARTADKREALLAAFKNDKEVYVLREFTIPPDVNIRDKPSGSGTKEGDSANRFSIAGSSRKIELENALVVHRGMVNTGKVSTSTDLWIAWWSPRWERILYISVAAINTSRRGAHIDINNDLIPGRLEVRNDASVKLIPPELGSKPISVGIDPIKTNFFY